MYDKAHGKMSALRQKLARRFTSEWVVIGALLATGAMPCPECGGPMVLHTWPLWCCTPGRWRGCSSLPAY